MEGETTILNKIENNKRLTKEEIAFMVNGFLDKSVSENVMSKFLLLVKEKGLSYKETFYLTDAMIKSGEVLDLSDINKVVVDKHSTGGVGDKVTFLVSPIVCALGIGVMKMSGRSLGFTGGTIDKLESIPGYRVKITNEEFRNNVNNVGVSVISQTSALAPADKKIYALRDEIGAVESIPLIASSIMSKKIASGAKYIVIDLKVGKGAFMKNVKDAKTLAKYMIKIGKYFDRKVVCVLTRMDSPLGYTVGNAIEVKEAIEFFDGKQEKRLLELVTTISSYMVSLGANVSYKTARKQVIEVIKNGKAKEKFYEWISNQGGDLSSVVLSENKAIVKSKESGYISEIKPLEIAELVSSLGAGRVKKEDNIDLSVGVRLFKTLYDKVEIGDIIGEIYYKDYVNDMESKLANSIKITSIKTKEKDIVIGVIK